MYQVSEVVKTIKAHNGASAGTTAQTTSAIDMQGYDGVRFIADLGTVVDASVLTLTVYANDSNAASGGTAITNGASASVTASTSSNTLMIVDVMQPSKRYVYATLTRTTQNATLNTIICELYRAKSAAITQDTTVLTSKIAVAGN